VFATSGRDAWLIAGAALHAGALGTLLASTASAGPPGWVIRTLSTAGLAVGLVWVSNTVSHVHLHAPVFVSVRANRAFSLFLTVVLGIPQSSWKRRHLRHHDLHPDADRARPGRGESLELAALLGAWIAAAILVPAAFFGVVLPVWLLGLSLCALQGHYEHADGSTAGVDHHGRLYNRLWFNDGHHRHHHRDPSAHWTTLGTVVDRLASPVPAGSVSAWPPLLRWLDAPGRRLAVLGRWARTVIPAALDRLERMALGSRAARGLLLATHAPALAALVKEMGEPAPRRICVVGGGLFPRSAILLGRLLPDAELVIVDSDAAHLRAAAPELERERERARRHGVSRRGGTTLLLGRCDGDTISCAPANGGASLAVSPAAVIDEAPFDLVVVPLALRGDRARFYVPRSGQHVLVHDWIWRSRGDAGRVVSSLLLKRVNLVRARPGAADQASCGRRGAQRRPEEARRPERSGPARVGAGPRGVPPLHDAKARFKEPAERSFPCTLACTLPVASAVEPRAEPPCPTTAPTTPTPPPPHEPVPSTMRPSPASERVSARLS
jgi:hypothetical protein